MNSFIYLVISSQILNINTNIFPREFFAVDIIPFLSLFCISAESLNNKIFSFRLTGSSEMNSNESSKSVRYSFTPARLDAIIGILYPIDVSTGRSEIFLCMGVLHN